jgi:2-dehydro-3-deoxygluconokinase
MVLVTFGEAMVRLTPADRQPLALTKRFDVYVGGAELNVAVAAAKLGVETRWVSRLPDNPVGRMIASRARDEGVDVSCIDWTPNGRAGVYYVEVGAEPGTTNLTYDRAGSAMALVEPGMIDWTRALRGARWLHVGGITPALSDSAAATLEEAMRAARERSVTVSYDLNYRPKLWSAERARATQEPLLPLADVLIAGEDAARLVFEAPNGEADRLVLDLQEWYAVPVVVITLRDGKRARSTCWSALVAADGCVHRAPAIQCDVVEPVGAGDSFCGGLIAGRLRGDSWETAARSGAALAALKHGPPGDFSSATHADVERACERGSTMARA